jgi:NADH:ubiquinone oxidoreductase subunit H
MLLMFFLAEYLHLVISAIHFIIFFIGGWNSFENVMVLPPIFTAYNQSTYMTTWFL